MQGGFQVILSLMFHHVNKDLCSNSDVLLDRFFNFISGRYETVHPNEYIPNLFGRAKLCLVFDDGYFDFYHYVYPLLVKYNLKAILAVPTKFICESTNVGVDKRLSLNHDEMMVGVNYKEYAPFCTWGEIEEMVYSGLVEIASHSVNHVNLVESQEHDVYVELEGSKQAIEQRLGIDCDVFVYPYGQFNSRITSMVRNLYKYDFAVGGAINYGLIGKTAYRVNADGMDGHDKLLTPRNWLHYAGNAIKLQLRHKLGENRS